MEFLIIRHATLLTGTLKLVRFEGNNNIVETNESQEIQFIYDIIYLI